MNIGIIGYGVLGKAITKYYRKNTNVERIDIYDKYSDSCYYRESADHREYPNSQTQTIKNINASDYIFICVPTPSLTSRPFNANRLDISEVIDAIGVIKSGNNVIIKSTLNPGDTNKLQLDRKDLNIVFSPEFLTEATAIDDFEHPDKQVIGYTEKSHTLAMNLIDILPRPVPANLNKIYVVRATEAEFLKLMINSYYAVKCIFGNQIFDICKSLNIDYFNVLDMFVSDKRISNSHFDPHHGGYRGFGGKCLPKDLEAMASLIPTNSCIDENILLTVRKINDSYQGSQE